MTLCGLSPSGNYGFDVTSECGPMLIVHALLPGPRGTLATNVTAARFDSCGISFDMGRLNALILSIHVELGRTV